MRPLMPHPPKATQPGQLRLWYKCLRKLPYTRDQAERLADERNGWLDYRERPYNAYECDHCGHHHVGHVPKRLVNPITSTGAFII